MKKLNTTQKVILVSGIIGVLVGIYGKFNRWEHDDYFIPFYMGASFMWIAFLDSKQTCCIPFGRKKNKHSEETKIMG